jgi:hypothetical protein
VSAVITICAQRKTVKVPAQGTPSALTIQTQRQVEKAWQEALAALPARVQAASLYGGRAFGLAKSAAARSGSPLYIISAGLGLVPGERLVPAYGLTVASDVAESISSRVTGPFDSAKWFANLMAGNNSVLWDKAGGDGEGRVLVALTKPYATMVGKSLAAASPQTLARLRIFGASLEQALPNTLHAAIVPYDDRLDALVPGTRSDFAQRALLHFVEHVADQGADRDTEFAAVKALLSGVAAPERPVREQRSDTELTILIKGRLKPQASASALLRQLRREDGIACEQGRFARLFKAAVASERSA